MVAGLAASSHQLAWRGVRAELGGCACRHGRCAVGYNLAMRLTTKGRHTATAVLDRALPGEGALWRCHATPKRPRAGGGSVAPNRPFPKRVTFASSVAPRQDGNVIDARMI